MCVTFGKVSSAFNTGNVLDKKSNVRFRMSSLKWCETTKKTFIHRFDQMMISVIFTMDTVRLAHSVPLDFVVFDLYSSHRKCCAQKQRHFCWGCLCTRDERACMVVDAHSAVSLMPTQQMHNIFDEKKNIDSFKWVENDVRTIQVWKLLFSMAYPSGGSSSSICGSCVSTTTALCKSITICSRRRNENRNFNVIEPMASFYNGFTHCSVYGYSFGISVEGIPNKNVNHQ